ncbi:hypothetical protein GCM10023329_34980 [Streptomyces sanyensis]|uniref:Uncharacterized protein n=1 Tax=Streptomyces sanyensis TaxID=568869 RepID=A0ABP9AK45_9ACTN
MRGGSLRAEERGQGGEWMADIRGRVGETALDMRRPPPGGRAGVVFPAGSGGEEPDRVSTVANDP